MSQKVFTNEEQKKNCCHDQYAETWKQKMFLRKLYAFLPVPSLVVEHKNNIFIQNVCIDVSTCETDEATFFYALSEWDKMTKKIQSVKLYGLSCILYIK